MVSVGWWRCWVSGALMEMVVVWSTVALKILFIVLIAGVAGVVLPPEANLQVLPSGQDRFLELPKETCHLSCLPGVPSRVPLSHSAPVSSEGRPSLPKPFAGRDVDLEDTVLKALASVSGCVMTMVLLLQVSVPAWYEGTWASCE